MGPGAGIIIWSHVCIPHDVAMSSQEETPDSPLSLLPWGCSCVQARKSILTKNQPASTSIMNSQAFRNGRNKNASCLSHTLYALLLLRPEQRKTATWPCSALRKQWLTKTVIWIHMRWEMNAFWDGWPQLLIVFKSGISASQVRLRLDSRTETPSGVQSIWRRDLRARCFCTLTPQMHSGASPQMFRGFCIC